MFHISAELLEMSGEAALILDGKRVSFANSSARKVLGPDCVGKSLGTLFGEELAGIQAASYIGEFFIQGRRSIVRVCTNGGIRALFFSPADSNNELLNDASVLSLRNCIMNMDINLKLLQQRDDLPEDVKRSLALVSRERFKINRIIKNISVIRSISGGNPAFSPIELDLSAHVYDTIDSLRCILPNIDIRFSSPSPITLYASPHLIDLLLLNLLSNAVIHASASIIHVGFHLFGEKVILSVDDNGCGIPGDELYCVFDRYRHNYGLNDMNRGAGLGLTAARLIAGLHGGTLLLESREGKGTCVRASLSLVPEFDPSLKSEDVFYEKNMDILLTGMADCLPLEAFSEKFSD